MWAPEQHVQLDDTFSYWPEDYDDGYGAQQINGQYIAQLLQDQTTFSDDQDGAPNYEDLTTVDVLSIAEYCHPQNPCPTTINPIPIVVHMQAQQYIELQTFIPPAVSAMTDNGLPVFTAGMNPLPTFGGQNENDVVSIVQPEPPAVPAVPAPPVKAPVLKKVNKRKAEKVEEGPYIKKPPNAFMLFLKEHRKSAEEDLGVRTSAVVNKFLGERWKSLPAEDKDQYNTEAKRCALLHLEQNPDWTNRKNYAKKRRLTRRVGVSTC
uniref:Transcription factor 7-like 1 n=1 Tax=Gouania willdenowi TaxID=441366 RepID=A0A8C5N329_GOUWI